MNALAAAFAAFEALTAGRARVEPVRLPPPVSATVRRRPAAEAAVTLPPVAFSAPVRDTAQSVREFVLAQFTASARRLAT